MTAGPTFEQFLAALPSSDVLTADIRAKLEEAWGNRPITDFSTQYGVYGLVQMLTEVLTEQSNDDRLAVAEALHQMLQRFGFNQATPTPAFGPMEVKVQLERTLDQMSLRELLEALLNEPDRHSEIVPYIEGKPPVQRATLKSNGLWAIPDANGKMDVNATLQYVEHLSKEHSAVQRMVNGQRPITLNQALGIDNRALIHPFTGKPVTGPDANDFDFSRLNRELLLALQWARASEHPMWPNPVDVYGHSEEVFQTPLKRRWQTILDDYRHALESHDQIAGLTQANGGYWPEGMSEEQVLQVAEEFLGDGSNARQNSAPQSTPPRPAANTDYRTQLQEIARGDCSQTGMDTTVRGGVYRMISIEGMDMRFDNVIVLQGGKITGMDMSGTIYAPPGVWIKLEGMGNRVQVINESWEELAKRAKLI
jgi:hypothetical protein